ncbi:GNAT family N-acetyltransferase [Elizabethkingia meningoseptica]|uniref:GNAT family N-acetyltransferase n=1 Tax=Elizabethkingia meningoseptica TaxID=238 RepID=UPI0023AEE1E3|nr:GNAT family N-acetyltransferase [Elizabethkingia meningoseptica]MDE5432294.1 GNAT family N-acetyltransferase [Elizabethkingia meningoseptica]
MKIIKATPKDIPLIQDLAKRSWEAAYSKILSPSQISYMMAEMYSEKEIASHMEEPGWHYFLVKDNNDNFGGFMGYQFNYEPKTTKLHRIYMVPESKGKGLGKFALNYLKDHVSQNDNERIILNVNKFNNAKDFYESQGFRVYEEGVFDIGNGYVMDDYLMEFLV